MGFLKDLIIGRIEDKVRSTVKDVEKEVFRAINFKVNQFKRKIMKEFISVFVLIVALIFLALAILFLLIEFLGLNKTLSFAVIGIVLLIIGLILRIK